MPYTNELWWMGLCDTCGGAVYTDRTWVDADGHLDPEWDECPSPGCAGSIDWAETDPTLRPININTAEFGRRLWTALRMPTPEERRSAKK